MSHPSAPPVPTLLTSFVDIYHEEFVKKHSCAGTTDGTQIEARILNSKLATRDDLSRTIPDLCALSCTERDRSYFSSEIF